MSLYLSSVYYYYLVVKALSYLLKRYRNSILACYILALLSMYFTIINIHHIHSFFSGVKFSRGCEYNIYILYMVQYHLYDNLPWTDNNRRLLTKPRNHLIFKAWSSGNGKRLGFSHFSGTGTNGVEKPNITLSNNRLSLPRIRGKKGKGEMEKNISEKSRLPCRRFLGGYPATFRRMRLFRGILSW